MKGNSKNGIIGKIGVIGRFKPLHNGGELMLEAICNNAEQVIIGIGSCNKYNARNPFTAEESEEMIHLVLAQKYSNYTIIKIPDYGHLPQYRDGKKWKETVVEKFGALDYFVSGNDYVSNLLKDRYDIMHPCELIPKEKQIMLKATEVRVEMARGGNWQDLVPDAVSEYITRNGLDKRFRKEFGLETLAKLGEHYWLPEDILQERQNVELR
jgi:nicotinamide-nucleotide adenylyltransferase